MDKKNNIEFVLLESQIKIFEKTNILNRISKLKKWVRIFKILTIIYIIFSLILFVKGFKFLSLGFCLCSIFFNFIVEDLISEVGKLSKKLK